MTSISAPGTLLHSGRPSLVCVILGHDWEQLTDWEPVEFHADFRDWVQPAALGLCRRCQRAELRSVVGSHTWGYGTDKYELSLANAVGRWWPSLAARLPELEDDGR